MAQLEKKVETEEELNARYVEVEGDTMTGPLIINPSTGTTALTVHKDIILKAGEKLIFDGG